MLIRRYWTDTLSGNNITILPAKCKEIKARAYMRENPLAKIGAITYNTGIAIG